MSDSVNSMVNSSIENVDLSGAGETLMGKVNESMNGLDMSESGAELQDSLQTSLLTSLENVDLSGAGTTLNTKLGESMASLDMSESGSGLQESIQSSITSSIEGVDLTEAASSLNTSLYGIGKDGRVCLIVDEANRSWCSSSNANDQRAVTIECASDMSEPYSMTNAVYEKLIQLCIDICKRNGKTKLIWFADKNKSLNYSPKSNEMVLTVHRWFANKSCPGDWLYSRLGDVANRVTAQLNGSSGGGTTGGGNTSGGSGNYKTGMYKVNVGDLNIRKGPGTNYDINGVITDKGTYTITEIQNGSWGKLKSGAGWINVDKDYCAYRGASSSGGNTAESSGSFQVQVSISDLYIRKGPGTNYGNNGFCPKGVYTIVETKSAGGYTWGRLKSGAGWIALEHTKRL